MPQDLRSTLRWCKTILNWHDMLCRHRPERIACCEADLIGRSEGTWPSRRASELWTPVRPHRGDLDKEGCGASVSPCLPLLCGRRHQSCPTWARSSANRLESFPPM